MGTELRPYGINCVNRGENGEPKTAIIGDKIRAIISANAKKRATRLSDIFGQMLEDQGIRTKFLPKEVSRQVLAKLNSEDNEELRNKIVEILIGLGVTDKKKAPTEEELKKAKTPQVFLFCQPELDWIVQYFTEWIQENGIEQAIKAKQKDFLADMVEKFRGVDIPVSLAIALFGRFDTTEIFQNVPAAISQGFSFSIQGLDVFQNYWNTGDDWAGLDESAANAFAMSDTQGMSSGIYYNHFKIDVDQLLENVGGDASKAIAGVRAFLEAFCFSNPEGMKNSALTTPLPSFWLLEYKENGTLYTHDSTFFKALPAQGDIAKIGAEMIVKKAQETWEKSKRIKPDTALLMCSDINETSEAITKMKSFDEVNDGIVERLKASLEKE